MTNVLGIDIGGTKIFHALVDENGNVVSDIKKELTPKTSIEIEALLKNILSSYEDKTKIAGIATAGAVSNNNDKILSSTANMPEGYSSIDFKNLSSKIKIFLENDANSASYAEHKIGAAKGCSHSITLTLGTGVGGGVIINNKLLKGKSGAAGEMHFRMNTDNKRKCTCNAYDCFEIYASGLGLKLTYKDITGYEISTYEIIEKFNSGEKSAKDALLKWNEYIAMGALGLNDIFDTEMIVLSGSMAQFADCDFIEKYVNSYTVTTKTKVKSAKAGNYAGLIGVSLLAFDNLNL